MGMCTTLSQIKSDPAARRVCCSSTLVQPRLRRHVSVSSRSVPGVGESHHPMTVTLRSSQKCRSSLGRSQVLDHMFEPRH